jgi:hypothetical protein
MGVDVTMLKLLCQRLSQVKVDGGQKARGPWSAVESLKFEIESCRQWRDRSILVAAKQTGFTSNQQGNRPDLDSVTKFPEVKESLECENGIK